jgi:hypothetical protein
MEFRAMAQQDLARLAVLIDADNTQPAIAEALLAEIAKFGVASVKRVYGDCIRSSSSRTPPARTRPMAR